MVRLGQQLKITYNIEAIDKLLASEFQFNSAAYEVSRTKRTISYDFEANSILLHEEELKKLSERFPKSYFNYELWGLVLVDQKS